MFSVYFFGEGAGMGDIEREGKSKAVTDGSSFFFLSNVAVAKIGVNRTSSFLPAGKNRRNKDGGDVNVYEIFSDFSVNNSKKTMRSVPIYGILKKSINGIAY